MGRGAWRALVHGVTESWTRLKQLNVNTQVLSKCYVNQNNCHGILASLLDRSLRVELPRPGKCILKKVGETLGHLGMA